MPSLTTLSYDSAQVPGLQCPGMHTALVFLPSLAVAVICTVWLVKLSGGKPHLKLKTVNVITHGWGGMTVSLLTCCLLCVLFLMFTYLSHPSLYAGSWEQSQSFWYLIFNFLIISLCCATGKCMYWQCCLQEHPFFSLPCPWWFFFILLVTLCMPCNTDNGPLVLTK